MNSQEPNKYVRLKRARITKAVALTRKSVCPRATGLYLAQIQSRVKINEKIIHGETRSHFISFSSSKGPHTQKNSLRGSLSFLSLSLSLSLSPFRPNFFTLDDGWWKGSPRFFFLQPRPPPRKKIKKKGKKKDILSSSSSSDIIRFLRRERCRRRRRRRRWRRRRGVVVIAARRERCATMEHRPLEEAARAKRRVRSTRENKNKSCAIKCMRRLQILLLLPMMT